MHARGAHASLTLPATAVALAIGGFFAWLHFGVGGERSTLVFNDLGQLAAPLLAALLCFRAAHIAPERTARRGWWFLGASAVSWGTGQAVWSYYEIVLRHDTPFPSLADAGYLGAVPLAVAGVLALPLSAQTATSRARTLIDSLIVAGSMLFVSWSVVLGPAFHSSSGSWSEQAIGLAYPAADAAALAIVIVALMRAGPGQRTSMSLVGGGLIALALADSFFVYLTVTGSYGTASVSDTGWFAGYLFIGLGAVHAARKARREPETVTDKYRQLQLLLPYIPLTALVITGAVRALSGQTFTGVLLGSALAVTVLLLTRQVLVVLENGELTSSLELTVTELEQRERLFRSLAQHSSDVVTIVAGDGEITYQSPSVHTILGYPLDALVGTSIDMLIDADGTGAGSGRRLFDAVPVQDDVAVVESRWRHRTAGWRQCETTITNLLEDQSVRGYVLNTRDVTDRKDAERELEHQALHDPLTGLPNRALFLDRLRGALVRITRTHAPIAVLFIDLDRFKVINDSLGHEIGDDVLATTAQRLRTALRTSDTVARFGGDEFVVLCESTGSLEGAVELADRLAATLRKPIAVGKGEVFVTTSVGLVMATSPDASAESLIRDADLAMYQAKQLGRAQVRVFDTSLRTRPVTRLRTETSLYRAVERNEFRVLYQPIVDIQTGALAGAEALLRWAHPERGMLAPEEFLQVAEETGLIVPIGQWVLDQACSAAGRLRLRGGPEALGLMTVNLSARQVAQPDIVSHVRRSLTNAGLRADVLCLEVNEDVIGESDSTVRVLEELRDLGVRLAIDDFGTGYSSLSHLRRFPVTMLKIDRSFVAGLGEDTGTAAIVAAITHMSRALGLTVVAEGVETHAQLAELQALGCPLGQGFLFGGPGPIDDLRRLTARARSPVAPMTPIAATKPISEPSPEPS